MRQARTIQVKDETKQLLDSLGRKGDTYDDIIRRLIEFYGNGNGNGRNGNNGGSNRHQPVQGPNTMTDAGSQIAAGDPEPGIGGAVDEGSKAAEERMR